MRRLLQSHLFQITETRPFCRQLKLFECVRARECGQLAVLTCHRVDEYAARPDLEPARISATPEAFRLQTNSLREHCPVVSPVEVLAVVQGRALLPPRAAPIPFDEAYRDFEIRTWTILRATLKEFGVRLAFLMQRRVNRLESCNPLQLVRIIVGRTTPPELLQLPIAL